MSCCGNKKDVAPGTGHGLKAKKVYGADNNVVTVPVAGFRPIPKRYAGNY